MALPTQIPFFGAPCSDAAGKQLDYSDIVTISKLPSTERHWDAMTQSPFLTLRHQDQAVAHHTVSHIWYDDPTSLAHKYTLVADLGLRGVGMWNADILDYSGGSVDPTPETTAMWHALDRIYH